MCPATDKKSIIIILLKTSGENYSFISIYHSNCGTNYTSRTDTSTQRDLTTSVTLGGKVTLGGCFAKNGQYYIVLYVTAG